MLLHVVGSCFAANQFIEITSIFLRFQTEQCVLRVNKSKITGEKTFNVDHFEIEIKHGSSTDEKTLFWVFLLICDQSFNSYTAKYVYVRFSSIVWCLQFLCHFLWVLEARSKLILFYTKFSVNRARFSRLHVLVCCCAANQYREVTGILLGFQTEECVLRVNKSKVTGENTFNEIILKLKLTMDQVKTKNVCFGYFADLWP